MTDNTDDEGMDPLQRSVDAIVATRTAREVYEAIDTEALLDDRPTDDAVDVDLLADAVGRAIGRAAARKIVDDEGATGLTKRVVGSRVTHKVAAKTFRIAIQNVDTGAVAERIVELDRETPGPSVETIADVGGSGEPTVVDVDDAGGGASGVHDAAGPDHRGVLDEADERERNGTDDPDSIGD